LFELAHAIDHIGQPPTLAHEFLGQIGIVPQYWIFGLGVQFVEAAIGDIPVKDASLAGTPKR
jgi:hypothetical protein